MKKSVSLFSCAGIGDTGFEKAGVETISACEIIKERAELMQRNFPNTKMFIGDIWDLQDEIVEHAIQTLNGERLFSINVTNPCQSFSSNGKGRMSSQIKKGMRNENDKRSSLIIPAINIISRLNPEFVVFENVSGMKDAIIKNEYNECEKIMSILSRRLRNYVLRSTILNVMNYGVPQNRKRLITIGIHVNFTTEERVENLFSKNASFLHPLPNNDFKVTLKECISHLPTLDAIEHIEDENDPFHSVPKFNEMQYFCMKHTPEGKTAFDNTICVQCNHENLNVNSVICEACDALLPRPYKSENNSYRLVKAFKTAYKRMTYDKPANALTTNSACVSSDVKVHPTQTRVLSLREIMIISSLCSFPTCSEQTFDYDFKDASPKLIRDVLGECIPPLLMFKIASHLIKIRN